MALQDTLKRFGEQFDWDPVIENGNSLSAHARYIVCGMGGSNLGTWLLKHFGPTTNLMFHREYGLPIIAQSAYEDALIILSSYSGTTEETLDSARVALERGLPMAAISTGGKLIEFAKEHGLPYIQIPDTGLEPRMAIGFSMIGIARLMQHTALEKDIRVAGKSVDPMSGEQEGKRIAATLVDKIPVIYSSSVNLPIAYIWKIKFNETAKIPAFCNSFPELCHNELTGFDVYTKTREISKSIQIIFLDDVADHPRNQKRMKIASDMLGERGIAVEHSQLEGGGFVKAFSSALLADWVSLTLADHYGVPNPETPMVAEFKHRIEL